MEQPVMQAPPGAHTVTYAGFWKRVFALIIDGLVLSIVCAIIFVPFFLMVGLGALAGANNFDEEASAGLVVAFIGAYFFAIFLFVLAEWLYFALMESKKGATLGKMALGIKVTDMDGNMISFGRATGRFFGKYISGFIFGIGYMMAGFTQQKQALHDILAKTLVVNK